MIGILFYFTSHINLFLITRTAVDMVDVTCAIGYIGQGCDTYIWDWTVLTPIALAIVIGVAFTLIILVRRILKRKEVKNEKR
jgi:hypothetical protein